MAADEVTCSSEDGEAVVIIKREVGSGFPAEIDWIAEDESAVFKNHYEINEGEAITVLKSKSLILNTIVV